MRKNPIVLSSERDGRIIHIEFIDGRKYKLQHPGNRTYLEWQEEMYNFSESKIDTITFLTNAFEHCVIPEGHDFKPAIDNDGVTPHELEVWQKVLRQFLRGEIDIPERNSKGEREIDTPGRNPKGEKAS